MLAGIVGIIIALWQINSKEKPQPAQQNLSQVSDGAPSSLSVQGPTGPLDLGQIPLSNKNNGLSAGSTSNTSSPGLDTQQFAQYDRYKTHKSALFADIQKGSGASAGPGKKIVIVYRAWTTNGTLVDTSKQNDKGQYVPFEFSYGDKGILPGLQQGLDGMKVKGTRMIIVPPAVGYGPNKYKNIPGNSVLIFEVYLVDVK